MTGSSVGISPQRIKGLFRALLSITLHLSHHTLLVLKLKIGLSNNQEVIGHVEGSASVLGPTLVGPLVLLNLLGAGLLVEPPEQFLVVEWNLLALKSVQCLLVPTQPLLTVCSPSPVIYSAVFC